MKDIINARKAMMEDPWLQAHIAKQRMEAQKSAFRQQEKRWKEKAPSMLFSKFNTESNWNSDRLAFLETTQQKTE